MNVIIAGGGTGGHLFPGIAVAREIQRRHPGSKILFVGAEQGIETRILAVARDSSIPSESIRLEPREAWTEIIAGDTAIMAITDGDARAARKTRQQLAHEQDR